MQSASQELALTEIDQEPNHVIKAGFNRVRDGAELVVATHVDTIQAMLLTTSNFRELDVMIKGRVGKEEEDKIVSDPLFQAFTKKRVEREKALRGAQMIGINSQTRRRLTVDQSADGKPFRCSFFRMNELVDGLIDGDVNATQLLINFGGATDVEIGSNSAVPTMLEDYAAALVFEVHARQLGEVPEPILRDRLN